MSNLCYASKTVLKRKFIAKLMPILEKKKCQKSLITNFSVRNWKKRSKLNATRSKEIKFRVEIIETKNNRENQWNQKHFFGGNISTLDKPDRSGEKEYKLPMLRMREATSLHILQTLKGNKGMNVMNNLLSISMTT